MKKLLFILIASASSLTSIKAQSIIALFKLVQAYSPSYIGDTIPDYIFKGEKYYPASNEAGDSMVYELESLDLKRNYLRIDNYYTTGQAAGRIIELRSYKGAGNKIIVVFSIVGAMHQMQWQNYLEVYEYKNNILNSAKISYLPDSLEFADFLKPNTPDSIIKLYNNYGNRNYELEPEDIKYRVDYSFRDSDITKWQQYNVAEFEWKNNKFEKKMMFEEE